MTMHQIRPAPVVKSQRVNAPPARAFEAFLAMGGWWPKTHSVRPESPIADVVLERHVGGRWYERSEDGGECTWGKVLAFEPPRRLVLAWQIDAAWQYDPGILTEVEVNFAPDGEGTLVTLEHRDLDRLGEGAEQVRAAVDSEGGWSGLLRLYADTV
jgi:uncharacterized protein YndB with AHSA1/START domain